MLHLTVRGFGLRRGVRHWNIDSVPTPQDECGDFFIVGSSLTIHNAPGVKSSIIGVVKE